MVSFWHFWQFANVLTFAWAEIHLYFRCWTSWCHLWDWATYRIWREWKFDDVIKQQLVSIATRSRDIPCRLSSNCYVAQDVESSKNWFQASLTPRIYPWNNGQYFRFSFPRIGPRKIPIDQWKTTINLCVEAAGYRANHPNQPISQLQIENSFLHPSKWKEYLSAR